MSAVIALGEAADGALLYRIGFPPAALPAVLPRDLERAWRAAGEAARRAAEGPRRRLVFAAGTGALSLELCDRDARCWAEASDRLAALSSRYGLSLCLRLLALIDLLARSGRASPLLAVGPAGPGPTQALLREAARAPLTDAAGFTDPGLQRRLGAAPRPAPPSRGALP